MKYQVGDTVLIQAKIVLVDEIDKEFLIEGANSDCGKSWVGFADVFELPKPDKTYEEGLEDAWELAKKIDSFDTEERTKIFGYLTAEYVKAHYAAQEALAKLKAYEDSHIIKVGDVVTFGMRTFVVTCADDEEVVGIEGDGYLIKINDTAINRIKKTGKRIDIAGFLEQIKGE